MSLSVEAAKFMTNGWLSRSYTTGPGMELSGQINN
jgi:hypothetical protein